MNFPVESIANRCSLAFPLEAYIEPCAGFMVSDRKNHNQTLDESIARCQRAIGNGDHSLETCVRLGLLYQQKQLNIQAASQYRKALELSPSDAELHFRLGTVLHAAGEFEDAGEHYRRARVLKPDFHDAVAGEALMFGATGKKSDACDLLQPIVESGSRNIHILSSYAELCMDSGCREATIERIEEILDSSGPHFQGREKGLFALGNLYDKVGNYERAFECIKQGNDLHASTYDAVEHDAYINRLMSVFSPGMLCQPADGYSGSDRPVFIVGMPRSGTSLVEQILSSHPMVTGCGELTALGNIADQLQQVLASREPYPECIRALTQPVARAAVDAYLTLVVEKSSGTPYCTDKMPENYLHLGLIRLLLPNARIIHCSRDPLDTCLSSYFLRLNQRDYSYRLDSLGHYYKCYQRLMDYWEKESGLSMLTVSYEALVADPQNKMREIIDFCGLDWDKRCEEFYKEDRVVRTASHDQARQPVYKGSVGRAGCYREFLSPLISALES